MACFSISLVESSLAAPPPSLKTAAIIDASAPEASTRWGKANVYEYPVPSVAPYQGSRKTFFGKPLGFDVSGLPEKKDCQVKITFLGDAPRTLSVDFNGADFDSQLEREKFRVSLQKGVPVTKSWTVPASKLQDGTLSLAINCIAGPNAVAQKIEIMTENGKPLTVRAKKRFEDITDEDLEKMVTPLPRISPRPENVPGTSSPLLSLNGQWEFSANDDGSFSPIRVPGEWTMQGFRVPKGKAARYRKTFQIPADWKGRCIRLRFDAVHSVCTVYVNGKEIGSHVGGFVPFELDATGSVQPGRQNVMEVKVQSESDSDEVSCLSSYASHQVGGLVRKVTLFALPAVHIASENTRTTLDSSCKDARLHYTADIVNTADAPRNVLLTVTLKDKNGNTAATETKNIRLSAGETVPAECVLNVPNARLWTAETPYLYTLSCALASEGKELVSHSLKTGLRQVEIRGNRMMINGHPVKLMGICRHEVHPLTGRSISPELCRKDAELYKNANVALVRTSHYPPSEEFLAACDELGLFVEAESAFCWVGMYSNFWASESYINPAFFPLLLQGNLDHLAAYRNHPSIIFWSMANESAWSHLWKKVMDVMKRHEKSRPIAFHDNYRPGTDKPGNQPDLANYHYPSENNPDSWSRETRPVWFGEYAHLQCYNRVELATDPFIQEDWSRPLQRMADLMWEQPGCLGGAIWSGIDDVFHLPDGNLCGYGHWGPIDGWRRTKPEYHGMRMAYCPVRFLAVRAKAGTPVELDIQNRQNFLNMSSNTIEWNAGGRNGRVSLNLEPHAKGTLTLPAFGAGEKITLSVKSPDGREIAREVITVEGSAPDAAPSPGKGGTWALTCSGNELTNGRGFRIPLPVPAVYALNGAGGTKMNNIVSTDIHVPAWEWKRLPDQNGAMHFEGSGTLGRGKLELVPEANGKLRVRYGITLAKDVNPRQWGLAFTLPRDFDAIRWNRRSHWSWYPADHIGRPEGQAKANPSARKFIEEPGQQPSGLWKDYSNALGSNDFRSTKANIIRASLLHGETAFSITPAGAGTPPQHVRAWIDGDKCRVLVAGFNTGGIDRFFNTHYSRERRPLKKGDAISSEFVIETEPAAPEKGKTR